MPRALAATVMTTASSIQLGKAQMAKCAPRLTDTRLNCSRIVAKRELRNSGSQAHKRRHCRISKAVQIPRIAAAGNASPFYHRPIPSATRMSAPPLARNEVPNPRNGVVGADSASGTPEPACQKGAGKLAQLEGSHAVDPLPCLQRHEQLKYVRSV